MKTKHVLLAALLSLGGILGLRADTVVVFNEVMFHPSLNESNMEWLELRNQMAVDVDVSGWSLAGGVHYTFPSNSIVSGGGFLLVASSPVTLAAATGLTNLYGPFTGRLGNAGDHLELRNNSDRLVDLLDYFADGDWPVAPDGSGVSLAKREPDLGSVASENWTWSTQRGGTPRAENFPAGLPLPAGVFNEVSAATNSSFWLELFNNGSNGLVLDGFSLFCDGSTNYSYVFPSNNLALAPGHFLALTDATLGFHPVSGDKLYLYAPGTNRVLDAVVVKKGARARSPDGTGAWLHPALGTPGASNQFAFRNEIVINEIMFQHAVQTFTNGATPLDNPEQWLELFNRSSNVVDLTGWSLTGGISYQFPAGQTLAPDGYLVVAKDAIALRALYPAIDILGNFGGRLSGKSDLVVLQDSSGNPANQVRYYDGAPWPENCNGAGSSLELRDAWADNSKPEAWAASDETSRSSWVSVSYTMTAGIPSGSGQPTQWNDFVFGLLDFGECLVDDLSVVRVTGGTAQMISNGDFETGMAGWRAVGTHARCRVELDPEKPGNHVLHIIASGPQEHMHNHLEQTLLGGQTIINGSQYQISYRARWLSGNNFLNTRLYFNRCARTAVLPRLALNGTPGARNSRAETNIGPTFWQLQHRSVIPQPGQPVTVSVNAQDPQGVSFCELWWSANGGAWMNAPMTHPAATAYAGTIPGYPVGTIVQFYVRAADSLGAVATFPAEGTNAGTLYAVADGQANLALGHNIRIILTPANTALLHALTNVMSNDKLPSTIVYDEKRAYYGVATRLKGSERGRYSDTRTSFHLTFRGNDLFRGVHPCMLVDRSGAGDTTANKQEEILVKHILNRAGHIPHPYYDLCRVIAPMSAHTGAAIFGPRPRDEFIETAYTNGGNGYVWKLELIYYPTTANAGGYKLPTPDGVVGTDFTDLGDDKEIYRYNWILKTHREMDDFTRFITFCKTLTLSGPALDTASKQVMDVDEWLRTWALVSLCGINDSYTFGNNHNLFVYQRPSDNKMLGLPWDMDFSFNRGSTDALVGDQNLSKVINLPGNLRVFYAHILDIISTTFNTSYISRWPAHYMKFCPGQDFTSRISYIQSRADYAKSVISGAGGNSAFALTASVLTNTANNLMTLNGTAPVQIRTIRVNGVDYPVTWNSVSSWTLKVPVPAASNQLVLTAADIYGHALTNFSLLVTARVTAPVDPPQGFLVVNEIMYSPILSNASYVELFNRSTNTSFDLTGCRLHGVGYDFPAGTTLGPRSYLVVAKSLAAFAAAYGTNVIPVGEFVGDLQPDGETLTLLKLGATPDLDVILDQVRYSTSPPWPAVLAGTGAALQLMDPAQDNSRVGNWYSSYRSGYTNYDWTFLVLTGRVTTVPRLLLYLTDPGELYLDDLSLVSGIVPAVGYNFVRNGDFEAPIYETPSLTNSYVIGTNYTNSSLSTQVKHGGASSLHLVNTFGGNPPTNRLIFQNLSPAPTNNQVCTLSLWYLPSPTASNLNLRIQSSLGLLTNFSARPNYVPPLVSTSPGANNLTPYPNQAPFPPLWLNEVQAENLTGPQDTADHRGPWLELYNAGTNVQTLEGLFLANDYSNLTQWPFPAGAAMAPGEFKVIFCDGATNESTLAEFHTSFTLAPGNGSIALSRLNAGRPQVLDYLNYRDLRADRSYGEFPEGQPFYRQDFYYVTPGRTNNGTPAPVDVRINEWMAANTVTLVNPGNKNKYDDWFELYNPTTNEMNLAGYYLTDTLTNQFQFLIPSGYVVPPLGFLLVWADNHSQANSTNDPDLHVNFQLSKSGEAIAMFAPDGTLIDGVVFGPQADDVSEGRYPDGSSEVMAMVLPTPGNPNQIPVPPTAPPVLALLANQHVTIGQTLTFPIHATDSDTPAQTLAYTLDTGAPAGAAIDHNSGQFTWRPLPEQAGATYPMIVRVTDSGTPPQSVTQGFSVTVWNRPQVTGVKAGDGQFQLSFATVPGKTYRIEFKTELSAPLWGLWQDPVLGTGSVLTLPTDMAGAAQRFYRVVQVD